MDRARKVPAHAVLQNEKRWRGEREVGEREKWMGGVFCFFFFIFGTTTYFLIGINSARNF